MLFSVDDENKFSNGNENLLGCWNAIRRVKLAQENLIDIPIFISTDRTCDADNAIKM